MDKWEQRRENNLKNNAYYCKWVLDYIILFYFDTSFGMHYAK